MSEHRSGMMLTTINNPHSPFSNYRLWYKTDIALGYDTCGLMARMSFPAEGLDDDETAQEVMATIVRNNFSGVHIMVTEAEFDPLLIPIES